MNTRLRVLSTLAGLAIVVGACSSGATQAPGGNSALAGTLTVWEAYGASGNSEKDAFDKIVAAVKAANSGLTVNVTDVPFNNLFTNFETQAGTGQGPQDPEGRPPAPSHRFAPHIPHPPVAYCAKCTCREGAGSRE